MCFVLDLTDAVSAVVRLSGPLGVATEAATPFGMGLQVSFIHPVHYAYIFNLKFLYKLLLKLISLSFSAKSFDFRVDPIKQRNCMISAVLQGGFVSEWNSINAGCSSKQQLVRVSDQIVMVNDEDLSKVVI